MKPNINTDSNYQFSSHGWWINLIIRNMFALSLILFCKLRTPQEVQNYSYNWLNNPIFLCNWVFPIFLGVKSSQYYPDWKYVNDCNLIQLFTFKFNNVIFHIHHLKEKAFSCGEVDVGRYDSTWHHWPQVCCTESMSVYSTT